MQKLNNPVKRAAILTGLMAILTGSGASLVQAKEDGKVDAALKAQAKVTEPQAITIAEQQVPGGQAKDAELEMEGGSLIYSVEVASAGKTTEVNVDARTGKVVSLEEELPGQGDKGEHEGGHDTDEE